MPPIARPWFRMYSDLLDNEKIDHLRVPLVKTWLKLLALANVNKPRGRLPALKRISYRLRISESSAAAAIAELKAVGLIDVEGELLVMHDWDDWQADRDIAPSRRSRVNHANVTDDVAENHDRVEESRGDKEREVEPEGEVTVPVVRAFERCFGRLLSPMEIESIKALDAEHPRERIDYALREAAELGKRSVRYIQSICENQSRTGDDHERKPVGRNGAAAPQVGDAAAELARINGGFGPVYVPDYREPDVGASSMAAADDQARVEVRR